MPPRRAVEARTLIRAILSAGGAVVLVPHALDRQGQRTITMGDVLNVLRGGIVDEPEFEHGAFRYRVRASLFSVVIELPDDEVPSPGDAEITVVTVMRMQS